MPGRKTPAPRAEDKQLEVKDPSPTAILATAIEKGMAPEALTKLMDLQERWERNKARKKFVEAITAFKLEAPAIIAKDSKASFETRGGGRTQYSYANLATIIKEITSLLSKHDLSASWDTGNDGNRVKVSCHITHVAGHRETVTLTAPEDNSGSKNAIQAIGSTVTYLQRYTLMASLGLATADQDDDGHGAGKAEKQPKKIEKIESIQKRIRRLEECGWSMIPQMRNVYQELGPGMADGLLASFDEQVQVATDIHKDDLIEALRQETEGIKLKGKHKQFVDNVEKASIQDIWRALCQIREVKLKGVENGNARTSQSEN